MKRNPVENFGDKQTSNGFNKNKQNINRTGANRKTVSSVNLELEAQGVIEVSDKDIKSCYLRLINLTIEELEEKSESEKEPALIRVVSDAILSGKGFDVIQNMIERAVGRPQQGMDVKIETSKETTDLLKKYIELNEE